MKLLIAIVISSSLVGCGFFPKRTADPNPLCKAECPDLTELRDDSFGATTQKLNDVANQYYLCRKACQATK